MYNPKVGIREREERIDQLDFIEIFKNLLCEITVKRLKR
jgi:hypothetical protein